MTKILHKSSYLLSILFLCMLIIIVPTTKVKAAWTNDTDSKVKDADVTITGTVTDAETGEPLEGTTVLVKGTNVGSITNYQGQYTIEAPDDASALIFSYVGYESVEVDINNQTVIDVILSSSTLSLDEVVMIGYGTQRRRDLTGAISSIGEEDFNEGIIVSPEQLIQGKVAGVNITSNNGEPGGPQTIIIRGPNSLRTGNTPLFVVDGVPLDDDNISPPRQDVGFGGSEPLNPLNFLNPADIESIDILKDASAGAIYGTRAANGVVMITTKKGTGAPRLNYSAYFGISEPSNTIELLETPEFIAFQESIGNLDNIEDRNINTDWQDVVFRDDAFQQNHSLSFSGGTEYTNYYVSLSYLDQEGILPRNELQRYTGRVNFSQRLIDNRLRIDFNLTASHTDNEGSARNDGAGANTGSLIPDMLGGNPTYPIRNADGSLFVFPNGRNPLADVELYTALTRTDRVLGNIAGTFEIIDGLEYKINFGIDRSSGTGETQIEPSGLANIAIPEGAARFGNTEASNILLENTVQYTFDVAGQSTITALAGHSYQRFSNQSNNFGVSGFTTEEIDLIVAPQFATDIFVLPSGNKTVNELQSFFGRVNYSFDDKFLLTATVRADGSSKFGENNRYGVFPSVAAAYNITEEPFLANSVVSNLKLRAGWGQTGNQEIPGKITQFSLSSSVDERRGGYPIDPNIINAGFTFVRTANPDIQWETTTQTNVGIDFGFFNESFYGSVDYFYKNTTDVLLNLTVTDPISPTGSRWENLDLEIINQGVEVALNYQSSVKNTFSWGAGINGTFLDNEVQNTPFSFLATGDVNGPGLSGVTVAGNLEGEPIGSFFLLEFLGFDDQGASVFRDANGDGEITTSDRTVAGSPIPDLTYGFYGNVGFKNVELSFNFNGVAGNQIFNNTALAYFNTPQLTSGTNSSVDYFDLRESATNPVTESTRYLEDGDFLRLNNLTLRYRFQVNSIEWLKGFSIYFTGQNLFTITDYSGFDPEVNVPSSVGGVVGYGLDFTNIPRPRTYLGGIDLSF